MTATEKRVLVTGSRELVNDHAVLDVLDRVLGPGLSDGLDIVIVQGECPRGGVDKAAEMWALKTAGAINEGHPADWDRHGKAAGMIRNSEMVSLGADLCLAFPRVGSRGTWDCIRKAADAGIPVRIYPLGLPV